MTSFCGVCPILHRIKKCSYGAYGAKDKPGDIPLPRSLTRYARSFGCGERYGLTDKDVAGKYVNAGGEERMRRCRFSIGSAPLTSITESDAQISGGETRCGLKIPGVSPWWLPRAPPHSCLSVYRCHSAVMAAVSHSTPDTQFREGSSLQDGLYARTPRSVRPLRLIR